MKAPDWGSLLESVRVEWLDPPSGRQCLSADRSTASCGRCGCAYQKICRHASIQYRLVEEAALSVQPVSVAAQIQYEDLLEIAERSWAYK